MTTIPHTGLAPLFLGGLPDDPALIVGSFVMTYDELTTAVLAEAARLGPRRLHVHPMRNDVDSVVRLLAALAAGHPVVLVGADEGTRHDEISAVYEGATDLHPDLAVLLSTSGSTGSPKLVRLSRDNLVANAESVAEYLTLVPEDRAITSLPLHYCYGLSVLTSHLASGASIVLTDLSVADECFWNLATTHRVTSFAGVPYTFDLLESSGFADRVLPDLRYVTQAGGRMEPAQVKRFAALGRERGFDLYVMYGQTEATARMAYLPPDLAAERPSAIGVPIPGGAFRLEPHKSSDSGIAGDVGELVYEGPNVMMGYALSATDLARGPEHTELRTGDLARRADDGLWEVLGRLDRHAKVYGLRLDLARLEASVDLPVALVAHNNRLHAFITRPRHQRHVREALCHASGLAAGAVRVHRIEAFPTTSRGKTDHAALRRVAQADDAVQREAAVGPATAEAIRDLYALLLGHPEATVDDSFVQLGGDSLSFVEVSIQLGRGLGHLPAGWQHLSATELAGGAPSRGRVPRRWPPVEIPVLLRAAAITLIVISHTDLWIVMGGAHVLLAIAGFNLARFVLPVTGRGRRARRLVAVTAAFAVPATLWIALAGQISGDYRPTTALYVNQWLGGDGWTLDRQFWFLENLVWGYLGLAVLLLMPIWNRWQRGRPFEFAVGVVLLTLALRYVAVGVHAEGVGEYTLAATLWCVGLGWAAAEARGTAHRVTVAVLAVAGTAGFFPDDPQRQAVLVGGMLLLLVPWSVRVPGPVVTIALHLASASMWIYLTHWQVYPELEAAGHQVLAVGASLALGVAAYQLQVRLTSRCRAWWRANARTKRLVRQVGLEPTTR